MMDRCHCGNLATYHVRGGGYVCDLHVERKMTNWRDDLRAKRWLKNHQTLGAPVNYKELIKAIAERRIALTPSINDIETSLNLSYSDSDAGETP